MKKIYEDGGITVQWWDDDQTIVYVEVINQPSWETLFPAVGVMNDAILACGHDVYKIYNFLSPVHYRSNWVPQLQRMIQGNPPNTLLVVFVQAGESLEEMLMITGKVFRLRNISKTFRFASTVDEALQIIEEHRPQNQES